MRRTKYIIADKFAFIWEDESALMLCQLHSAEVYGFLFGLVLHEMKRRERNKMREGTKRKKNIEEMD